MDYGRYIERASLNNSTSYMQNKSMQRGKKNNTVNMTGMHLTVC